MVFLSSTCFGRFDEASREIQRAQELDPLSPIININVGVVSYYEGHYDQAIAAFLYKVLELNPNFRGAHYRLGSVYLMKQMYSEAITKKFQTARALAARTLSMDSVRPRLCLWAFRQSE